MKALICFFFDKLGLCIKFIKNLFKRKKTLDLRF